MNKIYISGPITGNPNYKEQFNCAEKLYVELGYKVINPIKLIYENEEKKWVDYLIDCIQLINKENPDILYLITGWEKSSGANIEKIIFEFYDKNIWYEDDYEKIDNINPSYYKGENGIEAIDVIEAFNFDYYLGSVFNYISRAGKKTKETEIEDYKKAIWYLERKIKRIE